MNYLSKQEFIDQPLLTKNLIENDPIKAFSILPQWVHHIAFADPNDLDAAEDNVVVVLVGRKHKVIIGLSLSQFALLCELTRLGHSVATNSNFKKPIPKIYPKITFRDAPSDATPVARLFANAGPNESVSKVDSRIDLRPENLKKIGAGKPRKVAIEIALFHAERLLNERKAGGTLPEKFDGDAYLSNLQELVDWSLEEANLPELENEDH